MPHTSITDAANIMLRCQVSGLPVMDEDGTLEGIVSKSYFLRRSEIGTGCRPPGLSSSPAPAAPPSISCASADAAWKT
nr:CBS domain-containing protein [Bradyrhizobium sp. BRP22]